MAINQQDSATPSISDIKLAGILASTSLNSIDHTRADSVAESDRDDYTNFETSSQNMIEKQANANIVSHGSFKLGTVINQNDHYFRKDLTPSLPSINDSKNSATPNYPQKATRQFALREGLLKKLKRREKFVRGNNFHAHVNQFLSNVDGRGYFSPPFVVQRVVPHSLFGLETTKKTLNGNKFESISPNDFQKVKLVKKRKSRKNVERKKAIPSSFELAKTGIEFGISYVNSEIPEKIYSEEFENMIAKVNSYNLPEINEKIPLNLRFSINYRDDSSFGDVGIEKMFKFLTHYLLNRLNVLLPKIPNQLISLELATYILYIPQVSLLRLLDEKVIPSHKFNNSRCIKSKDLFKYKKQSDESRAQALKNLIQSGI